jgi:LysR family cyn operon transcriptional activator
MPRRPEPIEVHDLRAFLALVGHSHFDKAAKALGISQPAISQLLDKLEEKLEVQLIVRARGRQPQAGLRLTEAGRELALRGNALVLDLEAAERAVRVRGSATQGSLVIGYSPCLRDRVMSAVAPVLQKSLDLHVDLQEEFSFAALQARVADGSVDLGVASIFTSETRGVRVRQVSDLSLFLFVGKQHRLASVEGIDDVAELTRERFVRLQDMVLTNRVSEHFRLQRFYQNVAVETYDPDVALALVGATDLVAVLPLASRRQAERHGVVPVSLPSGAFADMPMFLAWRGRDPSTEAARLLVDAFLVLGREPAGDV